MNLFLDLYDKFDDMYENDSIQEGVYLMTKAFI